MAAKVVQINSFCGGSSKLVDSEFLGMEETINMYPETVTATDTYSTKVLKSVEGFNDNWVTVMSTETIVGMTSAGGYIIIVTYDNSQPTDYYVYKADFENNRTKIGHFSSYEQKKGAKFVEMTNGLVLCCVGANIAVIDPSLSADTATPLLTKPSAFDHVGPIFPTEMVYLNFRVIVNDNVGDSDYIYWSELNRPTDATDTHAFEQALTQYAYTKTDGTVVAFTDNVYYAPAEGTYQAGTLTTQTSYTSSLNSMRMDFKADKIIALRATDSHLFAFGSGSLQILAWQNSTIAPFAIVAKTSDVTARGGIVRIGNECFYVGGGIGGVVGVWAVGSSGVPRKVSTTAIDQRIKSDTVIESAFHYTYKGHSFYILSLTNGDEEQTICYDLVEESWTDRASYDAEGNRKLWTATDSIVFNGKPVFSTKNADGEFAIATFQSYEVDNYVNATSYVQRSRTTGIKYNGINDIVVTALELVINNGATDVVSPSLDGYNPKVMLQVSTDGGRTWSNELWAYAGKVGQYTYRTRWNCLGRGARFAFRVKMSDPVPFEIATAYLSYLPCGNRL